MRGDVKTNTNPSVLTATSASSAETHALDPALLTADAPTQDDVGAANGAARCEVRAQGDQAANFTKALELLTQANALRAKADAACQRSRR
jgi:hypothetical protein